MIHSRTVKGAKQTPPNTPLASKEVSKKNYNFFIVGHLRTQNWSTCRNIKKFKVVSRFLLWKKKFLKNHCIAEKFLSKMIFKEKKFVYTNERKLVWLFVKKNEHQTIIKYVLKKRLQEQKRQQKERNVYSLHFFIWRRKKKVKKKCNAAEVGRSSRIYSCLLFSCLHER